ncbi:MAG: type 1 glutamine amidotransferase [Gemmatimonadaceae bacterium]|nr:type 1 glutamine amidotransferase [Gemmatimonadaceae bacterium]
MTGNLNGRKVAVLATNGFEYSELKEPVDALKEAGADVRIVSLQSGDIQGTTKGEPSGTVRVDDLVTAVHAKDFDALILPGGSKNPRTLSENADAVAFARSFMESDKPVAAICHGPLVLVAADAVKGRTLTSTPKVKDEMERAGASWVDKAVSVDQKLVTSRSPADLPQFCDKVLSMLATAIEERKLDKTIEQSFPASDPMPGPTAL